jgi:hypothetical protein
LNGIELVSGAGEGPSSVFCSDLDGDTDFNLAVAKRIIIKYFEKSQKFCVWVLKKYLCGQRLP